MGNLTKYSLDNKPVLLFVLVVVFLGGIYSFLSLGKREDSTFKIKSAVVTCAYDGATAEEVEQLVVVPLERELRTLTSVHKISSEAHFGYAQLVVELMPNTLPGHLAQLWDELRRKVADAERLLPEGAGPIYVADDFGDVYGLYYALVSDGGYDWDEMRDYARRVQQMLYGVDGVDRVVLAGEQHPELRVVLSSATLSAFDLRPEDIGRAIAEQNMVVGLGVHRAGVLDVELVEGTTYNSVSDLENQLLTAPDGKQYRLGDVARVERGYVEPSTLKMRVNGDDAIAIAVATNPEMDIVAVGESVEERLHEAASMLPAGMSLEVLYPENDIARKANYDFLLNLIESLAIVVILIMLTLGWRSGVVVGSSLVLCIGATLLVMMSIGEGLNRTSLAGFIIAMGMLVDNAIVVVDNSTTLITAGLEPRVAVIDGARRPRMALLAATLIAILSFLPLQIAPSSVAEIIRPLFVVIALSLFISWLLALSQVPMMSFALLRPRPSSDKVRSEWFGRVIGVVLNHRWLAVGAVAVIFIVSIWAMGRMPQNFFPQLSKPYFRADVILPEGYDIEATDGKLVKLTQWLMAQPEVRRVSTTAGGTPPRYYLASSSYSARPNYGNILVELHSADATARVEERFDCWVTANVADVWLRSSLFRLSPVPDATIEFGFVGENIDTLGALTAEAMALMERNNDVRNVRNSWGNRVAVWQPLYSQIKAQRLGVERSSMISSLEMSTSGKRVATYREGDTSMPVMLCVAPSSDSTLSSLATMPVFSMSGRSFSVEQAVSGFDFGFRPSVIRRINSERVMKAQCDPRRGANAIALLGELETEIGANITLPEGYQMRLFGEEESRSESNAALASGVPITLIIIFMVLLVLFGNYREPLVVVLTLPLIFIGVVVGLWLLGKSFDFFSLLGLLGLVGMNVKSVVILLSRIDELRGEGLAPREAVVAAARDRFIPVVAASGTTILGMMPLLFDSLFGSMAATIMGGLFVATLLVLVVVPVVYSLIYRIR